MVTAAALLWSTGGFLIKLIGWNAMAINGARSAVALVFILSVTGRPTFTWSRWQIVGAVAYATVTATFTAATQLTTAANAILIQYTAPVYVALFGAWLLDEKAQMRDWAAIAFVLFGLFLFSRDDLSIEGSWGLVLAFASSLSLAALILCLRRQKNASPLETILLGNILAILTGAPFMLGEAPSAGSWIWIILLGCFQLGLPFILQTTALTRLTAVEVISIQVLEPVLNPVWAFVIVGERPGFWAIIGGAISLSAVTLRGILSAKKQAW
jgi:drug/metabolite transporter (DMT)-like permease